MLALERLARWLLYPIFDPKTQEKSTGFARLEANSSMPVHGTSQSSSRKPGMFRKSAVLCVTSVRS